VRFLSGGMKILVIDDDPFTLDALVDILHEMAFVETAVGGHLGVEAAFESQPDLILCDVAMPDLDGIEVCRRLSFDPRTSHIPIVCVSGGVGEAEEIQALSAGAVDYIKKPLNPRLVRARVKIHLDCVVKTAGLGDGPEGQPDRNFQSALFRRKIGARVGSTQAK
jgi:DNA-binding response OmpR family regulator